MELYQRNINRARRAYSAALSPRQGTGGVTKVLRSRGGPRVQGGGQTIGEKGRTTVLLTQPKESKIQFTAATGTGSAFQEGWSVRRLSASFERDARRYEQWL